jgi:hypothetical protein
MIPAKTLSKDKSKNIKLNLARKYLKELFSSEDPN